MRLSANTGEDGTPPDDRGRSLQEPASSHRLRSKCEFPGFYYLQKILQNHQNLAVCDAIKEELCRLYELTDRQQSVRGWKRWFEAVRASVHPSVFREGPFFRFRASFYYRRIYAGR